MYMTTEFWFTVAYVEPMIKPQQVPSGHLLSRTEKNDSGEVSQKASDRNCDRNCDRNMQSKWHDSTLFRFWNLFLRYFNAQMLHVY